MTENRFYEFFAGVGLARVGLAPKWKPLWANDFDPLKAETYAENFGSEDLHVGDVAEVHVDDLPGWAHLAWASFPCQDLSLAGWRRGMNGTRSGTFWAFWKLMRGLEDRRPPIIVLENVLGLLHSDDFPGLVEALVALDMRVGTLVVDAVHFVPQSRPRVFVIAVDNRVDTKAYEHSFPEQLPWYPKSVINAFQQLPLPLQQKWVWWNVPAPPKNNAVSIDSILEVEPEGVPWHSNEETQRLLSLMAPLHIERVREAQTTGALQVGFVYKRTRSGRQQAEIRFDGVAGCLRTPSGGSSRQTVVLVEGESIRSRLVSPRELARLMGAPEEFRLPTKYNQAYHAMGDAVVAPAVSWLADHLLTPLADQFDLEVGHYGWSLLRAGG